MSRSLPHAVSGRTDSDIGSRPGGVPPIRRPEDCALHPYVLVPLAAGVAAVVLATAILSADLRNRAHRITAAILVCAAYWSFLEVVWNTLADPAWVSLLVRMSAAGWMPLGVLCLHLVLELGGEPSKRSRRFLPILYGSIALSIVLYIATPWGIESVIRTPWGWSFNFGFLFPYQYLPVAALASVSITVLWRNIYPPNAPRSERRQAYFALAAMSIPLVVSSTTDALLPYLGIHVPRLGSASITLVGAAVAWSTSRYGYSVLAPGSFAPQILASLRDGVALLRQDGVIRSANVSFGRICARPPEDLVGRPIAEFLPQLDWPIREEIHERECQLSSAEGKSVDVSLTASFLRDRQGERVGAVLSVRDVTEVVSMRHRLVMSGRLSAVGELAAGIAHEINNPVSYVKSNLHQLGAQWRTAGKRFHEQHDDHGFDDALTEGDELIEESLSGVQRIAAIVKDVTSFAHTGSEDRQLTDLNALLDSTLRVAAPHLRYRAIIQRNYGKLPPVPCNAQEIKQVFLDVLLNASRAIEEGGHIRVETRAESPGVTIVIEDDGCGMPPEVRARIFDPFFTTEEAGESTGLGLSLCFQILRKHCGGIQVESAEGQGTRFLISLPVDA